ncbi:MAG TPA: GNAT family N-acetyltransferase [Bryobacteraceae bacterium]|nr:GNAT family N-acetyltransferase [Bryobacteraceae bacterium]
MKIRAATSDDLAAIATIQAASPEASQWDPAGYLDYDCLVAVENDHVAGFLVSRQTTPGEREILNVAVALSERRRSIARRLIAAELERVRGQWFLEVRESNIAALNLYKACGFQEAGRRNSYYHNPTESGIVMKLNS